jgi:hypothetical protein
MEENVSNPGIAVHNLDHLGIVAGIVDQLGTVEYINDKLGIHLNEKVRYQDELLYKLWSSANGWK